MSTCFVKAVNVMRFSILEIIYSVIRIYIQKGVIMPVAQGKIEVNEERCKACGLCIEVCPKKILALSDKISAKGFHPVTCINQDECIACTSCALICPDLAITVYKL